MRQRNGDWMQTYTGVQFWPMDPRYWEIRTEDIAHALANQCRFAGHCKQFYSVAQHSVIVSRVVPPEDALWGLLHDASEAYLVDLPRPIKRFSLLGEEYQVVEMQLMGIIADAFGLQREMPSTVKLADDRVLMTELRDVMGPAPAKWMDRAEPLAETIHPWDPSWAEREFLSRYHQIKAQQRDGDAYSR